MLKNLKIYVMGLTTGVLLTFGASYADEGFYQLTKMDCNIWANGQKVTIDTPVLNYDGRAYLPLRKVSEITNSLISWNSDEKTINIDSNTKEIVKEVPKEVTKEVIKKVPKEVIKEIPIEKLVNSNPYGQCGQLFVGYDKESNSYSISDLDSNGTGYSFTFSPQIFGAYKYVNKVQTPLFYMYPANSSNVNLPSLNIPNSSTSSSEKCLKLYSDEKQRVYLGKLTSSTSDAESIYNIYGTYGSKYSTNSIWNEYGSYGSKYSSYSTFNEYASNPPLIVDENDKIVGKLTVNKYTSGAISPYDIKTYLKDEGY